VLRSHLAIAFRHLVTQKLYSAINIVGLAVGLACFILIALFVEHELSYDRHYTNADRIHRVSRDFYPREGVVETYLATMPGPAAAQLKLDFPQIEKAARISCCGANIATVSVRGDLLFNEDRFAAADAELFEIFDFEWLRGDSASALAEPFTVVLTESTARKYFGDADPLGQTIVVDDQSSVEVTGVIRDLKDDTHLTFDMLGSLLTMAAIRGEQAMNNWNANSFYTYVLLEEGADIRGVQSQSAAFFERHFSAGSSAYTGFTAVPLTDIHLRSNRALELGTPGSSTTVYTFSAVAVFILLIACINFMNLATARSAQRAKEVGVRKAVGAGRSQVIAQFVGESVVLAAVAAVLAAALVELLLPPFNAFLRMELTFGYFSDPLMLGMLGLLTATVGIVAGSYPAFYLSAFDPARVLKGDVTRGNAAAAVRKVLVVLQFAISITLLIATTIVYQQHRFARGIELGYDKDRVVVVRRSLGFGTQWETLKREWLEHPQISHVTASNLTPGAQNSDARVFQAEGVDSRGQAMPLMFVEYGFFETYGIAVVAGRAFSEEFGADRMVFPEANGSGGTVNFVLNELAARQIGWTSAEAIGKRFQLVGAESALHGQIIGVVKDVYLESVRTPIRAMVYMVPPKPGPGGPALTQSSIRITGGDFENALRYIDTKWAELMPEQPIARRFLDEDFQRLYESEERQAQMFTAFSLLAIFVACLGLFGLASFTTERRTKEIGVRKVMGGSVWDIVRLFTTEFSKLVLLANFIAWPIAYFAMQRWLASYAYRIDMSVLVYAAGTLVAFAVAWATVGTVAARAANTKPIHALRYE
jgi:putative ABC transport system permease protein